MKTTFLHGFADELEKSAIDWGKLNPLNWRRHHQPMTYESDAPPKPESGLAPASQPGGMKPPAMGTMGSQTGTKQQLEREGVQF